MVLMRSAHCLEVSSHTQSTISLSSGESACYGIVKCAAIVLGARSMLADFCVCADVVVPTDSSSGLAVCSRRGLGHLLHVQTPYLWVQHRVQEGDLRLKKVDRFYSRASVRKALDFIKSLQLRTHLFGARADDCVHRLPSLPRPDSGSTAYPSTS